VSPPSTADATRSEHIPALDGLRGLAVLLVVVHTAGTVSGELSSFALKLFASLANPGWAGVQLFFALSGFLITRILLESKGAPGYFPRFYMRRVLRIFPLYYATLALVFFIAPHVGGLEPLAERGPRTSLWYWTYLANWAFPFGGLAPSLAHFWSLAVEEQFYIVWPALVLVLRERSLAILCGAMVLGALLVRALLFRIYEPITAGSAAYNFTIARCDALAMGALVAVLVRQPGLMRKAARVAGPVSVAILVVLAGFFAKQRGFNSLEFPIATIGQTLLAALSAALVLLCVASPRDNGSVRLQQVMSAAWLRSVGKYSYAIYVIDLPLGRVLRPHVAALLSRGSPLTRLALHLGWVAVMFVLSYALAVVSWHVIEQPFLRLKRFFPLAHGASPQAT
jgi:peptidoglycan/LPS O-acetylase OafA/YrhL